MTTTTEKTYPSLVLPPDEAEALRAVWRGEPRVDWDAYDRAKARVLAWEIERHLAVQQAQQANQ